MLFYCKQNTFNHLNLYTMIEKIKLSVNLYDNAITEAKGDYVAKPVITGTLRNNEIAGRIVNKRTEYRQETIVNILNMADQEKVNAIAEGKSVVDGVGQYQVNVSGSFDGESAPFNPAIHKLGVSYILGKLLRDTLKKNVEVKTQPAVTGPIINDIVDTTTGEKNLQLTSSGPAVISGTNIKVAGHDPTVGIYLTPAEGEAKKVALLIHNNPSQVTFMLPELANGEYKVSLTTQYGAGNNLVKEARTYTLPVLLYVGDLPSGDDNDRPEIE